ncbi:MAG: SDR family NAD(P)-dependent oxidoreductase [Verrucomicrobiota bacterium]
MSAFRKVVFDLTHAIFGWALFSFIKLKIHGKENLPTEGPFILVSNHCSHADAAIHFQAFKHLKGKLVTLAAEDYFFKKTSRRIMVEWIFNALPMGRERIQQTLLNRCSTETSEGKAILIFPEGTRQKYPEIAAFKGALGMLAVQCQVPIVPARIFGSHRALPKGKMRLKPYPVEAVYGLPLIPPPPTGEEQDRKSLYLKTNESIEESLKTLRRPSRGTVLITGASSGIGAALANEFAEAGYDLFLLGKNTTRLEEVAERCRLCFAIQCTTQSIDFSDIEKFDPWLEDFSFTLPEIDILVNNAGLGNIGPVEEADPNALDILLKVNIRAVFRITHALLPGMKKRNCGRILNIGSVYGVVPVENQAVYAATKAFVHSFSLSLRAELKGSGISVTSALPGSTQTAFHSRLNASVKRKAGARSAEQVARDLFRAVQRGRATCTSGLHNALFLCVARILPTSWVIAFLARFNTYRGLEGSSTANESIGSPHQKHSSDQQTP